MLVQPFVRGLVVIGRDGKDAVDAHRFILAGGARYLSGVVASRARHHRNLAVRFLQRDFHDAPALVVRQRWAFSGRAARDEEMDSGLDLPPHQPAQSSFVEREITLKWRNQRRTATCEHDVSPYRSSAFLNPYSASHHGFSPVHLRSREIRILRFCRQSSATPA